MQETKKTTAGLDVKLNKSASLYHCIRSFINLQQGENDPNKTFKLRWDNVYETMDMKVGENILSSNQLVKVTGDQASSNDKQVKVDNMKTICLLLRDNQKMYSFLLKQLNDGGNVGRDQYPVKTTSALDLLIHTKGGIWENLKLSTYENRGDRRGRQNKERIGNTFTKYKGGTDYNTNLVPGKDGTTLNSTCYNCRKPVHLA